VKETAETRAKRMAEETGPAIRCRNPPAPPGVPGMVLSGIST
jgi:hypothetical protein